MLSTGGRPAFLAPGSASRVGEGRNPRTCTTHPTPTPSRFDAANAVSRRCWERHPSPDSNSLQMIALLRTGFLLARALGEAQECCAKFARFATSAECEERGFAVRRKAPRNDSALDE